jgi:hypothetical protein
MELIILLLVVVAAIGWFIWSERQHDKNGSHPLDSVTTPSVTDVNKDSKTPEPVASSTVYLEGLDINKDGKVDIKDAVAAVEVVKEEVKTVAKKTATRAKKVVAEVETKAKAAVKKVKPKAKAKK